MNTYWPKELIYLSLFILGFFLLVGPAFGAQPGMSAQVTTAPKATNPVVRGFGAGSCERYLMALDEMSYAKKASQRLRVRSAQAKITTTYYQNLELVTAAEQWAMGFLSAINTTSQLTKAHLNSLKLDAPKFMANIRSRCQREPKKMYSQAVIEEIHYIQKRIQMLSAR